MSNRTFLLAGFLWTLRIFLSPRNLKRIDLLDGLGCVASDLVCGEVLWRFTGRVFFLFNSELAAP